jgi:phosphocarrier protein HPr
MMPADMSAAIPASAATPSVAREVTVLNRQGVHARPSAAFVKLATQHRCEVNIEKDGEVINGKSIMGLLMLAAGPGSKLRIVCAGEGAERALEDLVGLVNSKFGEE